MPSKLGSYLIPVPYSLPVTDDQHSWQRHGNRYQFRRNLFTQNSDRLPDLVRVPGVEKQVDLEIARGTQSGAISRIRGKGLPNVHGHGKGDLLVKVTVETPRKLSSRQEELLREFAETEEAAVSPKRKSFFEKVKDLFGQDDE